MHDSGNAYLAAEVDALCSQLKIDKVAAPKAKPFIRGVMERVFRTLHETLLSHIPGKTFSNTVARGGYDSESQDVLTLDDLSQILITWVTDIYHNSQNMGRDGLCPSDIWNHEMTAGMGCRPIPDIRTMTHIFGTTINRVAQSTGIKVMHVNYLSSEFSQHLMRDVNRKFRVRWWEENISTIQVEIQPRKWMSLEVMDREARSLSVDEWIQVLKRKHILQNPDTAQTKREATQKIDALIQDRTSVRRKVSRRTIGTDEDLIRIEREIVDQLVTPTTEISSEKTHGLYGVLVGAP